MPMPMPPQPQGGAPEAPQAKGAGSIADLVSDVHAGLNKLGVLLTAAQGVPPELKKEYQGVFQGFEQVIGKLSGQGPEAGEMEGTQSPEQGGNPNARPV